MLDRTGFVVTDFAKVRRFYDAMVAALGLGTVDNSPESFQLGRTAEQQIPYLWIGRLLPLVLGRELPLASRRVDVWPPPMIYRS